MSIRMAIRRRSSSRPNKVYTPEQLEVLNLLTETPIWIFDISEKSMFWANAGALELWNADSLESLLSHSFADDMSDSTERRLNENLLKFRKNPAERVSEQWTLYPQGKATPVHLIMSGIQVATSDGPRLLMLTEAVVPTKEQVDQESLRGVEMFRNLPVAVCQFDVEGRLMSQNPESLELFGSPAADDAYSLCSFQNRFVDKALGQEALQSVLSQKDYSVEAQQQTRRGIRWFSISLRLSKDPVTSEPVVLYKARDTTEAMEAKKESELAEKKKSEFYAVMAHELRTPLHQVIGFIDLLSQTKLTDRQLEYVNPMQESSTALMNLMNDLLDYTKIEAGKLQLESTLFSVQDVLTSCQKALEPKTTSKGLKLKCNLPKDVPAKLTGDPNRLRQILMNLLENSYRFTHSGGLTLSIATVLQESEQDTSNRVRVRFQVEDTGIGMCALDQEKVFRKHEQANIIGIARQCGGTGLGLTICKSLVEAMGGSISLESELGKGTKVSFEIPFDTPPKAEEPAAKETVTAEEPVHQRLNILVAEDNKINQKVIKAMLQRLGHQVTLANDGALAVERVEKQGEDIFDAILMDKEMPVMGGIEATELLRGKGYSIPIIGLTASYQPAERQYYMDAGMNDCLGKPARQQTIQKALSNVLKPKQEDPSQSEGSQDETSQKEETIHDSLGDAPIGFKEELMCSSALLPTLRRGLSFHAEMDTMTATRLKVARPA